MKQKKINLNLIISLVLAMLAVVSLVGYTHSYFTASAKREGTMEFATMCVRFAYYHNDDYFPVDEDEYDVKAKISLYPAGIAAIQRGVPFGVSPTSAGSPVENLAIHNMKDSCSAYVRFWINAYVIKDGEQEETNYGQYFTLNTTDDVALTNAGAKRTQAVYCLKEALGENKYKYIGATLTMSTSAPDSLMGETLRIDICMDSVQSANGAHLSVYKDDTKGYYSGW